MVSDSAAHDRHDEGAERRQELDLPPPLDARGNLAERVRATFTAEADAAEADAAAEAEAAEADADARGRAAGRSWCGRKAGYSVVFRGRTWRWASTMAVGMAVATMGRDDAAAGEECAGSDELPDDVGA